MRQISTLVVHCAATPNGKWFTAMDIDRWHQERGFRRRQAAMKHHEPTLVSIGYHFVILNNGAISNGRDISEIGAHVRGMNSQSIGTCLIGTDKFSLGQWAALKKHCETMEAKFPGLKVIGHNEIDEGKECPCFDVQEWRKKGMAPISGQVCKPRTE